MKFYLYYKEKRVLSFSAYIYPSEMDIKDVEVIDNDNLPLLIKTAKDAMSGLKQWLETRQVGSENLQLDTICEQELHMGHSHGRLYGYQHLVSLIHYYTSYFDDYCVVPHKDKTLCLGIYDLNLNRFFVLNSEAYKTPDKYKTIYTLKTEDYKAVSVRPINVVRRLYEYNNLVISGNLPAVEAYRKCLTDEFGDAIAGELDKISGQTDVYKTAVIRENDSLQILQIYK